MTPSCLVQVYASTLRSLEAAGCDILVWEISEQALVPYQTWSLYLHFHLIKNKGPGLDVFPGFASFSRCGMAECQTRTFAKKKSAKAHQPPTWIFARNKDCHFPHFSVFPGVFSAKDPSATRGTPGTCSKSDCKSCQSFFPKPSSRLGLKPGRKFAWKVLRDDLWNRLM